MTFADGVLSGQPPANVNGLFGLHIVAADGEDSVADDFDLVITGENDAPVLAFPIDDVSVDEDTAIDVLLPAETFTDPNDNAFTLTATLANGDPLVP